jgi:hypothetical protein
MSGFLKTFLIIIGGIVAGIMALAFFFQYGIKYIRSGAGTSANGGSGAGAGPNIPMILGAAALLLVITWVVVTYARPSSTS